MGRKNVYYKAWSSKRLNKNGDKGCIAFHYFNKYLSLAKITETPTSLDKSSAVKEPFSSTYKDRNLMQQTKTDFIS